MKPANYIPTDAEVKALREQYPVGTRIRLIKMREEAQPVPEGTEGAVTGVDDIGTIHMKWDNGSSIGLVQKIDQFQIINKKGEGK